MKIWSLPIYENLTTDGKYWRKEEKLLLRSNFSSFPQYFQYISNFKSPFTYQFVKCGQSNYFFLNSTNLICRTTDISKYFRESLGIRDNESRLYYIFAKISTELAFRKLQAHVTVFFPRSRLYSRLSLSRTPRDSMKYFEISVPRHIRFAELRKKLFEQPHLTNIYVIGLLKLETY